VTLIVQAEKLVCFLFSYSLHNFTHLVHH